MKLPTVEECHGLFTQYHVPENIHEHCTKVSEFATAIARKLRKTGIHLDVQLVETGGLLHDWMKAVTLKELGTDSYFRYTPTKEEIEAWKMLRARFAGKFKTQFYESDIAYELLKETYPELGEFILNEGKKNGTRIRTWEEKLVHYADWRVMGTKIVPLKVRMAYFFDRYKKNSSKAELQEWKIEQEIELNIEKEICTLIGCTSDELEK